jgi:hypothetical protein
MKVLYAKEYIKRVIYVIEDENKVTVVYRSSGLSGTGHEGKIIPFYGINTDDTFKSPGYINKLIYFGGRFIPHRKEFAQSEKVKIYLDILEEFTEDLTVNTLPQTEVNSIKELIELADNINKEIAEVIKDKEFIDYSHIEEPDSLFKVTLISKDKNYFEVDVNAFSSIMAMYESIKIIDKKGWDIFGYEVHNIRYLGKDAK